MIINKNFHEKSLILILLGITLSFIFWIIPESIEDPENFGLQDGLNPSFAPYLVGFFGFFTLVFEYVKNHIFNPKARLANEKISFSKEIFYRSIKIIIVCLFYSFFLIETLGFYLASLIFITLLSFFLGEKRILILFFFPILLMTVVFVSFEIGFNIFLPEGIILPKLSSIF